MDELFKKITMTISVDTSQCFKQKRQSLLADIGEKWYMDKLNTKLSPIKKTCLIKKDQENHDKIKKYVSKSRRHSSDWEFQVNWKN